MSDPHARLEPTKGKKMVKTQWMLGRGMATPYFYFDTYAEAINYLCSDAMKGLPTDGWAIVQQNIVYSEKV